MIFRLAVITASSVYKYAASRIHSCHSKHTSVALAGGASVSLAESFTQTTGREKRCRSLEGRPTLRLYCRNRSLEESDMAGCEAHGQGQETFTFFWKSDSPFSQWHIAKFTVDGRTFNCAEQYMMYKKAVVFKDLEAAEKIMQSKKPSEQKNLGRKVRNYNDDVWNKTCFEVVKTGNRHKFMQNPSLKEQLLATHPTTLVEASPLDKKWGIGLTADDPAALDRKTWQGENLLGAALTEVRDEIMAEERKGH